MSSAFKRVAVVIPAYNEAGSLGAVIRGLPDVVGTIIVVDDGSTDPTPQLLHNHADPRLVVLRHPRNRGVGAAIASGYQEALRRGAEIVAVPKTPKPQNPKTPNYISFNELIVMFTKITF